MPLSLEELRSINDGDTVRTQEGTAVRLTGFNAPEVAHENTGVAAEPGAAMSTQLTQEYLQQPGASADVVGQDVYGRTLGRASAPGLGSLAEEQLKRGLASPMATEGRISDAERRAYLIGQRERRSPSTPEQARINQQLDREWQGATTNAPNVRQKFKRDIGDTFSDAIDRGMSQMGMMVGGTQRLLGEMTGLDSLARAGDRRIDQNKTELVFNPADVDTMDKVNNVGDGFTYVIEKLGEQGPNLVATIGTAAATGGVGAALRLGATKLASEKLALQAASSAMGAIGKGMTLTSGAMLGAGTLNIGESKLNLDEIAPDGDHNLLALSTGLMKTGLDVMSLRQLARPLMGLARQRGMNPGEALKAWGDIPAEVGRAALIEGGTEALQGLLDEAAGKAKYGVDINWQNVKESGVVGAISGGGFAVPINVASVGLQKALQPGEARPGAADPNAGPAAPGTADPAAARAEYEAALQRVQDLQQQADGLAPGSPERTAAEEEMDALAARGLELQGSLDAPPGGTTAEPGSDIAAQMAAAADPNNPKPGVWMAGGGIKEVAAARAAGLEVVTLNDGRERGLFASADPALRQKLYDLTNAGMPIEQALAENLYNIPADTKARAAADPNPVVVQEQDAQGNVVAEAAASQADAPAVSEALAEQRVEGGQQVLTDPVSAQKRRQSMRSPALPKRRPIPRAPIVRVGPAAIQTPAGPVTATNRKLNERYDDILTAIHLLGGMEVKELAEAGGFDEADLKGARRPRFTPFRVERTNRTQTPDGMRESLADAGYLAENSNLNDMYERIERALRGERVLSQAADMDWFAQQETAAMAYDEAARQAEDEYRRNTPDSLLSRGIRPYQTELSSAYDLIMGVRSDLAADRVDATAPGDPRLSSTPSGYIPSPTVRELQARSPDTTVQGAELITRNSGQLWIAGDGASPAADPNANLTEPGGPFVGPPTTDPGRVGDKAEHIAHKQLSELNADAAMQLPQQLANPIEYPAERGVVVPKDEQGNPIREAYPPNQTTMVTTAEGIAPQNPPERTAVPAGGTLVVYGKRGAPAQRAASIVTGAPVQDRITRVAQEGQAKNRKPVNGSPKEGSGLQRLEARLRALPYVKRLMLVASRESSKVQIASGKKISVADRNNQILALVRDALFAHLDSVHGIESSTQRERGTTLGAKYGSLIHQIANHVSDKDLNEFVEAAHNDKRNTLNAVGRAQGVSQDQSVGQAQQGRTLQDDDNGRAPAQEEYAGEEVEYEQGFNARGEDAPARAGLREFSDNLSTAVTEPPLFDREGKRTGKRWTLDQMFAELRQNPLFANNTPAEIAERFNKWVSGLKNPPRHLLASFVELAHKTYAERASDPAAYNASSTAARRFESKVNASPAKTAEQNDYQRDIADFGVTRDVNNAIDLSPEQAAYDREQQAERARRGQPAEPVPKTERQVARFRGSVENKVNLDAAENDGLTADTELDPARQNVRTLAEMLFGDLAPVADVLNGLRNRTGQINAQQVVDSLLKNGKPSKVTRLIFSALKPFLAGYQIVFDAKASEPGSINPGNKVITIRSSMRSAEMLHVMLHEMVHAATVDALHNNAGFVKEITRLRSLAQAHLEKNAVRDAESLQEIKYGLTSNDEFVAQLFSSPAFVEFLETATDAADPRRTGALKTLFNEVISALKKALGLADNVTLAAQAMDTVLSELAKGPMTAQSRQGAMFAPSIRPLANAIRNAEPVQRVLNAPQGARLRTLGTEVASGTGKAKNFLSRAVQSFLTSDHQLRQILTDSLENEQLADQIADRIYVRPGTKGTVGYMQRAEDERDTRLAAVESLLHKLENEVVDGRKRGRDAAHAVLAEAWAETEWANAALGENLRVAAELERRGEAPPEGRPQPPLLGSVASDLQKIFGQVATYIESAGVRGFSRAYGRNGYYLPQIHDKGEVKARFNEFVSALIGLEYVNPVTGQAGVFNDASAREYANALIAEHESNSLADLPWSGSLKHRTLTDPAAAARLRDAGFMESSVSNIINYYVDAVTKATEFEREFGGYAKTVKRVRSSDPRAQPSFEETDQFETGHRLIRGTLHGLYGMPYSSEVNSASYRQAFERAMRDGVIEATSSPNLFRVWQRDMQFQRDVLGKIKSKQGQLRFQAVFAGMQGNLGADMNPQWRRTQQWLLMVESITTLGFSTLSSLPELGVLAAGAPDWAAFRDGMKAVVVDRKSAWELLRDMGLAGEHIAHIALADNGVMRGGELPRVIMDKFFKLNGQHYWTQFLRAVALQMFKSTAQRFSESGTNAEFFEQYGVSREDVTQWLADDTPAFTLAVDSTGQSDPTSQFTVHPVAAAMRRFVNEHIAMPNRANVPLFFNDPRFALLVQLKRFFYAYGSQVLMRMARQAKTTYQKAVDRGDTRAAAAVLAAYPYLILGAFSLPLAAASRELKEYLKYNAWGEEAPKYATEGLAYWVDLTRRTGVLGPADLAVSLFDERAGGMESLMGPLAAHLDVGLEYGFFSKEFARRSTPIVGQLNGVWK